MPEIPEFTAQPVAIPEARRSYVSPEALAAPGTALERTGADIGRLGETFGRIREMQDYQYVADQWADATTGWHDKLQNAITEAQQSGNYQNFAGNLRQQLDQDLQQRLENAPSSMARARLERHFATLTDQVSGRAAIAEHAMATEDSQAKRFTAYDNFAKQAYRDPTLATDLYAQGKAMSAGANAAGLLNPAQQQKEERAFGDQLWTAHLLGRAEHDPTGTMADLNGGRYDPYLDPKTLEAIKPRLENAVAKGIIARMPTDITGGAGGDLADRILGAESGGQDVKNPLSSASGPGQFLDRTWLALTKKYAPDQVAGKNDDQILALKGDKPLAHQMVDAYAAENKSALAAQGLPTDDGSLYLAHFLGPAGAAAVLKADPTTPMPQIIRQYAPDQADAILKANPKLQDMTAAGLRQLTAQRVAPPGLKQLYDSVDKMNLDPETAMKVKAGYRVNYDALEADQARQQRVQQQQQKQASDAAENEVIADAQSPQPKITARDIANRSDLTPDAKLRMIAMVGKDGQADPGTSHRTAMKLMADIAAGTVTERAPIIDQFNQGNLTWTDFDHVSKQVDDVRTAGGELLAKRKADLLKSVTPSVDPKGALGISDLAAQENLYKFSWLIDEKVDEYRKAGKNPGDLFNPHNPDFVGNPDGALKPFISPFALRLGDAAAPPAAAAAAPAALDSAKSLAELQAMVKSNPTLRAQAVELATKKGWLAAPAAAPAPAPQAPIAR